MAANGNLIFQDTNKATFVGANSNVVIDTVHASFGVGVDVNGPTSNLHVVGNAYVTSNLEVGTANLFVDTVNSRVGVGTTSPGAKLEVHNSGAAAGIGDLVADFTGSWIRIGDARSSRTFSGGSGIKFYDTGVAHYSVGQLDGKFKISVSSGDGDSLFPSGYTEGITLNTSGNVGIGEDNPTCKLTVGDDTVSVNSSGGVLGIRQKGDTSSDGITLTSSQANSTRMYKDANGHFHLKNMGGGTFTFENGTGDVVISGYLKTGNPAFYAYRTIAGNADDSYITYEDSYVNLGNHMNVSAGIFTCPVAGIYTFTWGGIGKPVDHIFRYYIHKNNSKIDDVHLRLDNSATGNEYGDGERTVMLSLAATDTIRIHYQDSTGSEADFGYNYTYFQGHLISST